MAKPPKKQKNSPLPPKSLAPQTNSVPSSEETEKVLESAIQTEEDLKVVESISIEQPEKNSEQDLSERYQNVLKAQQLYEAKNAALQKQETELSSKKENFEKQQADLKNERVILEEDKKQFSEQQKQFEKEQKDYLPRFEELIRREAEAEAGFIAQKKKMLESLSKEITILSSKSSEYTECVANSLVEQSARHEELLRTLENELLERRQQHEQELAQERKELAEQQSKLKVERRKLKSEQESFEEDKATFFSKNEEKLRLQISKYQQQAQLAQNRAEELSKEVASYEDLMSRFQNKTPAEILQDMQTLKRERDDLKEKLDSSPSTHTIERLKQLEDERSDWELERDKQQDEISSLKHKLSKTQINVTELETLRDAKKILEKQLDLLRVANEELSEEVDKRIRNKEAKSVFPACIDMDEKYQDTIQTSSTINLGNVIKTLQKRIAYVDKLYYDESTLRSFLAGLAMSRLHLLQGISGTGKTSLPLAFFKAIGGASELIEVQAGWRDRQDLIGHYNAFEKSYYESPLLQALYQAQCPTFSNRCFVIILDEMNLSHPEQYFADFLSKLEQPQEQQKLKLMTAPIDNPPKLFDEDKKTLKLPPNVWFIGTANHDETTKDFADKTYDRAHVMEMPRHHNELESTQLKEEDAWDYEKLKNAFDIASKKHKENAKETYTFITNELGNILQEKFGVSWGNRLERQIQAYVPVVIETGGTLGEATDHIIATKLFRKIKDRYDTREEYLTSLQDIFEKKWLDSSSEPSQSLAILKKELERLKK